jgi:hypothetical protein
MTTRLAKPSKAFVGLMVHIALIAATSAEVLAQEMLLGLYLRNVIDKKIDQLVSKPSQLVRIMFYRFNS